MICCAMLCYAMLLYAMLCYVILCCAMLFYAMLCYLIKPSVPGEQKVRDWPLVVRCHVSDVHRHHRHHGHHGYHGKDNNGQPRLRGHHKQQPSTAAFCGLKDASRDRALWRPRGRRARQRRKTTQWNHPKRNRPNLPNHGHANRPKRNRPTGPSCMQMHSNTNSAGGMEAFPSEHQVLCASCL